MNCPYSDMIRNKLSSSWVSVRCEQFSNWDVRNVFSCLVSPLTLDHFSLSRKVVHGFIRLTLLMLSALVCQQNSGKAYFLTDAKVFLISFSTTRGRNPRIRWSNKRTHMGFPVGHTIPDSFTVILERAFHGTEYSRGTKIDNIWTLRKCAIIRSYTYSQTRKRKQTGRFFFVDIIRYRTAALTSISL
jgi:hypothetical protein